MIERIEFEFDEIPVSLKNSRAIKRIRGQNMIVPGDAAYRQLKLLRNLLALKYAGRRGSRWGKDAEIEVRIRASKKDRASVFEYINLGPRTPATLGQRRDVVNLFDIVADAGSTSLYDDDCQIVRASAEWVEHL